ncbi:MAG: hypothetical protein AB8G22_12120 [Saprospiraceae bacterium]
MSFWQNIKNLFQAAEESSPTEPVLHSVIERNTKEKEDYEFWKATLVRRRLTDWLSDQYAIYRVVPDNVDEALDFLDTPSKKGFVIHFYKTQYSKRDTIHFLDYFKEQVKALNYRSQLSDTRTFNRKDWVETIERHYLKPRTNFDPAEKLDQRYGNIMVELELRDDKPYRLKFSATSYQDHLFKDADDFKELMQMVLQ